MGNSRSTPTWPIQARSASATPCASCADRDRRGGVTCLHSPVGPVLMVRPSDSQPSGESMTNAPTSPAAPASVPTSTPTSLLTHIALPVRDLDKTLAFYRRYTTLEVIHERADADTGMRSVWLANP